MVRNLYCLVRNGGHDAEKITQDSKKIRRIEIDNKQKITCEERAKVCPKKYLGILSNAKVYPTAEFSFMNLTPRVSLQNNNKQVEAQEI